MRVLRPSSEDEMVAILLRGEFGSSRFDDAVGRALARAGAADEVVTAPDLSDAAENILRRQLLTDTRAYGTRDEVFGGFPDDVQWDRVLLAREELPGIRYIDWSYWNELSGGTRSPVDAARRIVAESSRSASRATASSPRPSGSARPGLRSSCARPAATSHSSSWKATSA